MDIGENDLSTIVCGAPNVRSNIKVPVAKIGATLDNGNFKIKKTKLRGVTSSGMICSGKEISYNNDHDGILVIVSDEPLGSSIENVLNFEKETIFDIDLTPNRGDCFSHKGIAREISIFEESKFKPKNVEISSVNKKIDEMINLKNIDTNGCPRYTTRVISNVKIGPSPKWLVKDYNQSGKKVSIILLMLQIIY